MSCPSFESEIAKALAKELVKNSDLFLVSDNGTTYKVTIADLVAAIGATGAITSTAPAGTSPVLTGTAPNYQIRGIQAGSGLNSLITAQDAIRLNLQVANAGGVIDGLPMIVNSAATTVAWRRLKAGNGITVDQDGNSLVITNNQIVEASNTVTISVLTDFPSPVAGVIALADNTDYIIVANIDTTSRFTMGNNTILRSVDPRAVTLQYTGNETMFTCNEGSQVLKEISLSCPNGKLFNNNGTTTGSFVMRWVRVVSCLAIGDLSKPLVGLYNLLFENVTGSLGFVYTSGANKRLVMDQVLIQNPSNASFTFLELGTATFDGFVINLIELFNTLAGQTFLSGAAGSANLPGETFGYIDKLELLGPMTPLAGIQYGDPGWNFSQSAEIPTTTPLALTYLTATATTTIAVIDTPVKINGVFAEGAADYFITDATGRITMKQKRSGKVNVEAIISARPLATSHIYTFYIALNGVIIANSGISRELATAAVGVITISWIVDMATDDFVEVWVENNESIENLEVQKLVFKAN